MTDAAIIAIAGLTVLCLAIAIFNLTEALRIRKARKRYLELIETMTAEQALHQGGEIDRRAFRKTLGGWEQ